MSQIHSIWDTHLEGRSAPRVAGEHGKRKACKASRWEEDCLRPEPNYSRSFARLIHIAHTSNTITNNKGTDASVTADCSGRSPPT